MARNGLETFLLKMIKVVECIIMQSIAGGKEENLIKCLALRYTYRRFSFMIRKKKVLGNKVLTEQES